MKETLSRSIAKRLNDERDKLTQEFKNSGRVKTRRFVIDELLSVETAAKLYRAFPDTDKMRLMSSFREKKYTSKALGSLDPIVAEVTFALQAPEVIEAISAITGFKDLEGDPKLYAGGISSMVQGHFLNPHIDNSHDSERKRYRALNILYYVTPDWEPANGGNLELWDTDVKESVEIPSRFNRLVVMETNHYSWHSVNPIKVKGRRNCVSNYFFSPHSPADKEYFHITAFSARPEQPFRRVLSALDNSLRTFVRGVIKGGLGKKDLYGHQIK